ncbi:MAG TPA: hypothetical protein VN631_02335 [Negativicutes bacterium]|nr:hypothetical protein [Negativicutes bacterium]
MKKIFSCIVIGAMLVYLGGLGAANAQDRPPQNGQQDECRPTKDHPCPPPTNGGNQQNDQNGKHKPPHKPSQDQPECKPTKNHPCPPSANNESGQHKPQQNQSPQR